MSEWKKANKAYTKSQKARRADIREEFEWTLAIPIDRPELLVFGQWKWIESLIKLNNNYKEASENRDELINNTMFLFAAFRPDLLYKVTENPNSLTDKERGQVLSLLKSAISEGEA